MAYGSTLLGDCPLLVGGACSFHQILRAILGCGALIENEQDDEYHDAPIQQLLPLPTGIESLLTNAYAQGAHTSRTAKIRWTGIGIAPGPGYEPSTTLKFVECLFFLKANRVDSAPQLLIHSIFERRDAIIVLPTGTGKSDIFIYHQHDPKIPVTRISPWSLCLWSHCCMTWRDEQKRQILEFMCGVLKALSVISVCLIWPWSNLSMLRIPTLPWACNYHSDILAVLLLMKLTWSSLILDSELGPSMLSSKCVLGNAPSFAPVPPSQCQSSGYQSQDSAWSTPLWSILTYTTLRYSLYPHWSTRQPSGSCTSHGNRLVWIILGFFISNLKLSKKVR